MSDWRAQIPGCFGVVDKKFAGHILDEERASELRDKLRADGVPKQEIEEGFEDWLAAQTWNTDHSKEQMDRVKSYFDL